MFAWRVHEYGAYNDVLRQEEIEDPSAPAGGVVVDVKAAGLNFFDILSVAGKYQVKAPLPFTPGTEAAGVVSEAGAGSKFEVGQRVIATNLMGAFAAKMLAPDGGVFPIPAGMSDAEAAGFLITYQTSYFALVHRAALAAGETLLVHGGAGGVGTSAIQIGKALGATVIATAGGEEKLQVCRDAGADHVIDYRKDDFVPLVKEFTKSKGANVIYDPVGGDVFDKSTKCIAWNGRLVVIGFAGGRIPEIKANRILLKNIAIVGLNWGGHQFNEPQKIYDAHDALTELYTKGDIKPVLFGNFGLPELPAAMEAIESRKAYGKIVLRVD